MKLLKHWWHQRRVSQGRKAYRSGYIWACSQILAQGLSITHVESSIQKSPHDFDRGAWDACQHLREFKLSNPPNSLV